MKSVVAVPIFTWVALEQAFIVSQVTHHSCRCERDVNGGRGMDTRPRHLTFEDGVTALLLCLNWIKGKRID